MPWLSIIMAILSFLASMKKDPDKKGQAVAAAALGGLGTYYVTHETEWGRENLGSLDGVVVPGADAVDAVDDEGKVITTKDASGKDVIVKVPPVSVDKPSSTTGWDVLKNWGATGTAAVVGTTAVATDSSLKKYLPWLLGGLVVLVVLK